MTKREYYSIREGGKKVELDLSLLLELFLLLYEDFKKELYFAEAFGVSFGSNRLPDDRFYQGVEKYLLKKVRKKDLWPIETRCESYSEDDLFDVIEFLYDCVSKLLSKPFRMPAAGDSVSDGYLAMTLAILEEVEGAAYKYDREAGRYEFRSKVNELLADYKDGYGLSEAGEILILPDSGLENLLETQLPKYDPENVEKRVEAAKLKFRRSRSSMEDRRDAVRDLAEVLEFLRPKLKEVIRGDESDLFHIANKFGVRHHGEDQKTDYDKQIWYSWMFYYYLATIHASLKLIKKSNSM